MTNPVSDAIFAVAVEHRAAGLSLAEQRRSMLRLYCEMDATMQEQIIRLDRRIAEEHQAERDAHRAASEAERDERRMRRSA